MKMIQANQQAFTIGFSFFFFFWGGGGVCSSLLLFPSPSPPERHQLFNGAAVQIGWENYGILHAVVQGIDVRNSF